jgi:hypothetical protein
MRSHYACDHTAATYLHRVHDSLSHIRRDQCAELRLQHHVRDLVSQVRSSTALTCRDVRRVARAAARQIGFARTPPMPAQARTHSPPTANTAHQRIHAHSTCLNGQPVLIDAQRFGSQHLGTLCVRTRSITRIINKCSTQQHNTKRCAARATSHQHAYCASAIATDSARPALARACTRHPNTTKS